MKTKTVKRDSRWRLVLIKGKAREKPTSEKIEASATERSACKKLYRDVRATIREGFESGKLKGFAVHRGTGAVTSIEEAAVWLEQDLPIFFVGIHVLRSVGQHDRFADVIIKADNFAAWMATRIKEEARDISVAMLKQAGSLIGELEQRLGCNFTRGEALMTVCAAAKDNGLKVSQRQFKKFVWAPQGRTAGRRRKSLQPPNEATLTELQARIADLFAGRLGEMAADAVLPQHSGCGKA